MNLNYISGFFDADGSITMVKPSKKSKYKTLKIDFTNTYLNILEEIQLFLLNNYNIKGYLSKKPKRKENHNTSFSLSYTYNSAIDLSKLLKSFHPKKIHRLNTINKYFKNVTVRNGKYTKKQKFRKLAFERLFFLPMFP